MKAEDVRQTLDEALLVAQTHTPPKLLSDNGSCYLPVELAEYLNDRNKKHVLVRSLYPQTPSKIEYYQISMKNVVKLNNYFSPGQLESKMSNLFSITTMKDTMSPSITLLLLRSIKELENEN